MQREAMSEATHTTQGKLSSAKDGQVSSAVTRTTAREGGAATAIERAAFGGGGVRTSGTAKGNSKKI